MEGKYVTVEVNGTIISYKFGGFCCEFDKRGVESPPFPLEEAWELR